jgi:hypothetical protein
VSGFLAAERARAVAGWEEKLAGTEDAELLATAQGMHEARGRFPRGSVSAEHQADLMEAMIREMARRGLIPGDDEEGEGST